MDLIVLSFKKELTQNLTSVLKPFTVKVKEKGTNIVLEFQTWPDMKDDVQAVLTAVAKLPSDDLGLIILHKDGSVSVYGNLQKNGLEIDSRIWLI